ncbi:unnamed protein product [Brachionus calyciflorus]|uniref:Uncharacterized protein n=1 Tax=Brachionus calyciflorus TaxID=104777 RepID=A0A814RME9_9BILA|nr:unnamed protein product [Brachionus calyciflorus]
MRGCQKAFTQSYLDEFMWRNNYGIERHKSHQEVLKIINEVYDSYNYENDMKKDQEEVGENDNNESDDDLVDDGTVGVDPVDVDPVDVDGKIDDVVSRLMLNSKSIEHNNSYELVKNFQRLISELGPDSQLIIRDLNSYQQEHIENINNQLDSLKLSKSKQISLNIKKDSLSMPTIYTETRNTVENLLSQPSSKKRGRKPKCKTINLDQQSVCETNLEPKKYNLRKRK